MKKWLKYVGVAALFISFIAMFYGSIGLIIAGFETGSPILCVAGLINEAQLFKTSGSCKAAMNRYLYERVELPMPDKWGATVKFVKHPEWFDEKFEIVPVEITRKVITDETLSSS